MYAAIKVDPRLTAGALFGATIHPLYNACSGVMGRDQAPCVSMGKDGIYVAMKVDPLLIPKRAREKLHDNGEEGKYDQAPCVSMGKDAMYAAIKVDPRLTAGALGRRR